MNLCYFIVICYFIKFMNYDICFTKKNTRNIFGIGRPSVLGIDLLAELTAHPLSLLFAE